MLKNELDTFIKFYFKGVTKTELDNQLKSIGHDYTGTLQKLQKFMDKYKSDPIKGSL